MGLGQRQKALEINLNPHIYGTFAEIGAGQEVARHFFRAGGAAGTIAKSISAYDMTVSDSVYGKESSGRYVCEDRLHKMLDHEFNQLVDRLSEIRHPDTTFFAFADTVAAKSYRGTGDNHGWLGVKFQHKAKSKPSEVIMHIKMLDAENTQQQEAVGLIGVNLIHAIYNYAHDREQFISGLMDGLSTSRIQIDMIRVSGDAFLGVDSRLLCLELVKRKLCEAVIFDGDGKVVQASDVIYKKNVLVLRGGFRPPTLLSLDMLDTGLEKFKASLDNEEKKNILVLPEISMSQLIERGMVDNEDFLARVDLLSALGHNVLISSSDSYAELNIFLNKLSKKKIAYVMGTYNLEDTFMKVEDGKLLHQLGGLFEPKSKVYVYPSLDDGGELKTTHNMTLKDEHLFMLLFLTENKYIEDITDYDKNVIHIWSRTVLRMIQDGDTGWEKMVPKSVAKAVKTKCLFGAKCDV